MLRTFLAVSLVLAAALGLGGASAWFLARKESALPTATGWHVLPDRAALAADPYRGDPAAGRFPLDGGPGAALFFAAGRSDDGAPLQRNCSYALAGPMPRARIWTLSALDETFAPLDGARSGLSSAQAVWQPDGGLSVTVGAEPSPGNWLPLDADGKSAFLLLIGLYDARSPEGAPPAALPLPSLTRLSCKG